MSHIPNKKQEEAFNDVIKAINKAKKLGLVFYGKQYSLVAYTKEADKYIGSDVWNTLRTGFNVIPHLTKNVLSDSGADDYSCYLTKEDEIKYSEES